MLFAGLENEMAIASFGDIVPLKWIEHGVYGDLILGAFWMNPGGEISVKQACCACALILLVPSQDYSLITT